MTIQILILFFIANLINVMLATIKSIVTARSDDKFQVSAINAITYGFYVIIVKQIAHLPLTYTVTFTIIANFIGVSASMHLLQKLKKDKLWKISLTAEEEEKDGITLLLNEFDIKFSLNKIYSKHKKYYEINVYSYTQNQSRLIKDILSGFDVKYHYSEVKTRL